ncbi:MAG: T9SS type A sorting domain-containing protein [Calditrichaceae bacterium]
MAPNVPELKGKYIYADYVTSWIWALTYDGINEADNETLAQSEYNISSFGVDENNELYICTFNGVSSQIYQFTPTITSAIIKDNNNPHEFRLGDNYPNPFNPGTHIPFTLHSPDEVKITIFDIHGRIIKELNNGTYQTGNHSVYWNGKNEDNQLQSSGIYFCQMTVGFKFKQTKRLVLLK